MVDRNAVGLALAGVLAGLAALLLIVSVTVQPFLIVVALPFAAGAYLVWKTTVEGYADARRVSPAEARRARARAAAERRERTERTASDGPGRGRDHGRERTRERDRDRRRARGRGRDPAGDRGDPDALSRREAARVLGVAVDADPEAVQSAYRDRVKEVHPDTEGGDAETFQRVTAAYERLR